MRRRRRNRPGGPGLTMTQAITAGHYLARRMETEWSNRRLRFEADGELYDILITDLEVDITVRFEDGLVVTVRAQRPECFDPLCPVMTPHEEHER